MWTWIMAIPVILCMAVYFAFMILLAAWPVWTIALALYLGHPAVALGLFVAFIGACFTEAAKRV